MEASKVSVLYIYIDNNNKSSNYDIGSGTLEITGE